MSADKEENTDRQDQVEDMAPLVGRMRDFVAAHEKGAVIFEEPMPREKLRDGWGFAGRRQGKPEVILSEDVHVELGHPSTASHAVILVTRDPSLVRHGRVSVVGPNVDGMAPGSRQPFAQVVVLGLGGDEVPDPFDLENTQYLMHRLPGYMVRSVPGRLWVRISREKAAAGLSLHVVGSALISAFADDYAQVEAAEVVFVTGDRTIVEELAPLAADASILSGRNKKLAMGEDGEYECTDLNCDDCDNLPVCDNLRDVVVKRRKAD
ncbi:MAG: hypothetical protein ACLFOY_03380 [Desulfatibacillaceae bacterium]